MCIYFSISVINYFSQGFIFRFILNYDQCGEMGWYESSGDCRDLQSEIG